MQARLREAPLNRGPGVGIGEQGQQRPLRQGTVGKGRDGSRTNVRTVVVERDDPLICITLGDRGPGGQRGLSHLGVRVVEGREHGAARGKPARAGQGTEGSRSYARYRVRNKALHPAPIGPPADLGHVGQRIQPGDRCIGRELCMAKSVPRVEIAHDCTATYEDVPWKKSDDHGVRRRLSLPPGESERGGRAVPGGLTGP